MKSFAVLVCCSVFVLPAVMFPLSASGAPSGENGPAARESEAVFTDVLGKEWILAELRNAGNVIRIDRNKLSTDNMAGYFTVSFQESQVNGVGAPNRFFGPYTAGGGRALSLGNLASTLMMAFKEPDNLNEREYFAYLSKVNRWDLRGGKLELCTYNSGGGEAVLVFERK